jgi:hypothetical protein
VKGTKKTESAAAPGKSYTIVTPRPAIAPAPSHLVPIITNPETIIRTYKSQQRRTIQKQTKANYKTDTFFAAGDLLKDLPDKFS